MTKHSQLSQLKSAAHQSSTGEKKRKRSSSGAVRKDQAINPFDLKVTRPKHDVGGRKIKGQAGKPALKNQAGIDQRKRTLLIELDRRNKAGGIVDRRFGENDPSMSLEERMLERFTRERQSASKNSIFNLEDDTELTHYGQSLSNLDDFDTIPLESDSEDGEIDGSRKGQVNAKTVSREHFGGFDDDDPTADEPPRKKSKAEVMAEVIAKSKEHKLKRQMENEREEQMRHELDADFRSIQSLFLQQKDQQPTSTSSIPLSVTEKSYDQIVHELAFDIRSKPKDRTKTEEELALERKEELERAERRRIRRMSGEDDFDSESEDNSRKWKRKWKQVQGVGGDEDVVGESDDPDSQWPGLGKGLGEDAPEVEVDGEEDMFEDIEDGKVSEGDGDEGFSEDASEGEGGALLESIAKIPAQALAGPSNGKEASTSNPEDLPYTFPCPSSHKEWLELVENYDSKQTATVIQRILTLYHPSLGAKNPEKLQTFQEVLIDHLLYATAPPDPEFTLVDEMLPAIIRLTRLYPTFTANAFKVKLQLMERNFQRGLSAGPHLVDSKTFPGTSELALLRLVGAIWSTSDQRHPVVGPAMLLMGAYLELGRVRSLKDLSSGLFIATLFYQYENLSKRLIPEAINFLLNAILLLAPNDFKDKSELPDFLFAPGLWEPVHKIIRLGKVNDFAPMQPNLSLLLSEEIAEPEQAKVNLLAVSLKLLRNFGDMYQVSTGSVELLEGLHSVVSRLVLKGYSSELQLVKTECEMTLSKHLRLQKLARRPLLLQAHKPIPIATYAPKFSNTKSTHLHSQDPDRERAAAAKLRREYKQERKGALRELRRDAQFLAREKQERQAEKDQAYKLSMRRALGSIEVERAEEKRMLKEKRKEKKRAGRK